MRTSIIIAISNRGSSLCMVLKEMYCLFLLWKFSFPCILLICLLNFVLF